MNFDRNVMGVVLQNDAAMHFKLAARRDPGRERHAYLTPSSHARYRLRGAFLYSNEDSSIENEDSSMILFNRK